jgi:hypothetical protein
MQFIAFAYTYHYLNWFSKTSVIGWHRIGRRALTLVIVLWLGFVGLYAWDYRLGMSCLFVLGLAHVVLEFPLNHLSFMNVGGELRRMLSRELTAKPRKRVSSQPV